ncbi:type IV pilus twitching motility protein PilT [Deinococcus cellulosilyticus]|uniref:Twitching motility protein PilT n=1 Tax=Deinococcus cellulosilyticus (strain DSM 18568 / NBRC 106333 / KACC 11606 / 5516J-15) TaxID=1223518 RepID=A0A511MYX5_DEIC1|nr:type IV pilus twitching motility protein PilT [Deinococcus cellulosilyticus]GEM45722.1 twitching motility protein PilT [Deinococcus cellulosilyticus NBRC 106333 = KACC 11606]
MALDLAEILRYSVERKASDIIITVGIPPQFKIHGQYTGADFEDVTPVDARRIMYSMMNERQQKIFEEKREMDFSFAMRNLGRFRVNVFMQQGVVGGVLRLIPTEVKSLSELGMPDTLLELASAPRGLVLVTGPTGSGKSTTLASMIDWINVNKKKHIVTIEDPIEFTHPHKNSIVNQREIGADTWDFNNALRAVLRQAPDVILVGEMRDYETIKAAVTAAETGHLVMGTLHTNSAPESIDRIVDVFPEEQQEQIRVQLANNLVGIVTQQLMPKKGGDGRVIAYEVMIANPAIRALIREGKSFQITSIMQTSMQSGMVTMDACLASLAKRGVITEEMGNERAVDAKEYNRLLKSDSVTLPQVPGAAAAAAQPQQPAGFGRGMSAPTQQPTSLGRGTQTPPTPPSGGFGRK